MNLIDKIENKQIDAILAQREVPEFGPGDTLRIDVKVVEGTRERVQGFEGVCIGRKNDGIGSSFTVRKISYGEGVERVFPLYSPKIQEIVNGFSTPHLFVRLKQKVKNRTMPFVYCGRLEYLEHEASTRNPVHIVFENIDYQDSPNQNLAEIYSWKPGLGKPGTTRQVATRTSKRTSAAKQQTVQSSIISTVSEQKYNSTLTKLFSKHV